MDDFVRDKLREWGLGEWIEIFEAEAIDKERLYYLKNEDITLLIPKIGPRVKFRESLKLLKEEQNPTNPETFDSSVQVCASTSNTNEGKRKVDLQGEGNDMESPARKRRPDNMDRSYSGEIIRSDVKNIMKDVCLRLPYPDNKLSNFLKNKISDLETDKRELVGVFGRTGAGKSSLINAVIGVKNLLPFGEISACTSVMIKVEANMENSNYEADIEFITKEEWNDEVWSLRNFLGDTVVEENDQETNDYQDAVDKLSALYGEQWKKPQENLMDDKYFKGIPEFLHSKNKVLKEKFPKELSAKLVKYTRDDSKCEEGKHVKKWYWPLVKCVTVKVPKNDLLKHVTLVDLPGTGDCNKSRDTMWKGVVGKCSTVWIVTEINRAAAEKEPWEILENACGFMGNGGECQRIHFICTKSDTIGDSDDHSDADVRSSIIERNNKAKQAVTKKFKRQNILKKHFSHECFKVFTVSSKEFLKKKILSPKDTEIPELQEFLQELNDCYSETLNYVSGAHGIVSLIQGASRRSRADENTAVCSTLEERLGNEHEKVRQSLEMTHAAFEKFLSDGVEQSKSSCEKVLERVLQTNKTGRGFHRILKCVVENNGTYTQRKNKKTINLNMKLASCLTDSIDEEFKKTFPNEGKCEPFNGAINAFSLDTKSMMGEMNKDVELQLIFLETEEEQIETKLNKIIRDRKKMIYSCLTTTIEDAMQVCYDGAKKIKGDNMLKNQRETITRHVLGSKDIMFQQAKDVVMKELRALTEEILKKLRETMQESINLSLKTDCVSIPDVREELELVKGYLDALKRSQDEKPMVAE